MDNYNNKSDHICIKNKVMYQVRAKDLYSKFHKWPTLWDRVNMANIDHIRHSPQIGIYNTRYA